MINEQTSFRITDNFGSRFIVEERIDHKDNSRNYRIGIFNSATGETNYFYATEGQYRLFIQSEAKQLSQVGR